MCGGVEEALLLPVTGYRWLRGATPDTHTAHGNHCVVCWFMSKYLWRHQEIPVRGYCDSNLGQDWWLKENTVWKNSPPICHSFSPLIISELFEAIFATVYREQRVKIRCWTVETKKNKLPIFYCQIFFGPLLSWRKSSQKDRFLSRLRPPSFPHLQQLRDPKNRVGKHFSTFDLLLQMQILDSNPK